MILRVRTPDGGNHDIRLGPAPARMQGGGFYHINAATVPNMMPFVSYPTKRLVAVVQSPLIQENWKPPVALAVPCGIPLRHSAELCARASGHTDSHKSRQTMHSDSARRRRR